MHIFQNGIKGKNYPCDFQKYDVISWVSRKFVGSPVKTINIYVGGGKLYKPCSKRLDQLASSIKNPHVLCTFEQPCNIHAKCIIHPFITITTQM